MMLVSVLFFYGKWLFAARNTSYVIHINVVIPGKFDKAFNRHANFAFFVVRICCLRNMYYICDLSLVKVIYLKMLKLRIQTSLKIP